MWSGCFQDMCSLDVYKRQVRDMSNKVSGKRQKGADSPELREKDARSMAGIMGVFAVAVLGIFPLAYDNYYYNILETKYHFYCVASIAAMALMLFYGIFSGRIAGFFRGDGRDVYKRQSLHRRTGKIIRTPDSPVYRGGRLSLIHI